MDELKELVDLGMRRRIGKIELFEPSQADKSSLFYKLYNGIKTGRLKSDADGRDYIYGDGKEGFKFNMLKKRLKERLYTTILFIQPRNNIKNSHTLNAYWCYRHFAIARMLTMITARRLAMRLYRKIFKLAIKFEIFDVAMLCALELRREAYQSGDNRKFAFWDKAFVKTNRILRAEAEAQRLYYKTVIHFVRSGSAKSGLKEYAEKALVRVEKIRTRYSSYFINYYYFNLKTAAFQLASEYKKAYEVYDDFERFLNENPQLYSASRRNHFLLSKIDCSLYVKEFEDGQKCITEALKTSLVGQESWFILQESYFLLSMITGNFRKAAFIYDEVTTQEKFAQVLEWRKERWKLFSGYLWFALTYSGEEEIQKEMEGPNPFRISKLVNEIPIYQRDKRGYNVGVLIMQIANLILKRDYPEIITRSESLRRYLYEVLKRDHSTMRSQIFIRLILSLVKYDFDLDRMKARTEKLLNALKQNPVSYSPSQAYIEVIPYEDLWAMIEKSLSVNERPAGIRIREAQEMAAA